jgi:hypothetical protein
MSQQNEFLEAALKYVRLGWNVIPLQPRDKKPLLPSWREWQTKKVTEDIVKTWWQEHPAANVGVLTGAISGVVVLDVDGENGRKSLAQAAKGLPPTPISNTGKGSHYIYKHPGFEVRNFAGKLPGLDFRGDGGYIVAPPSIHPSRRKYEWAIDPGAVPPSPMPEWLLKLLEQKKEANGGGIDPLKVLAGVPEGQRDETLFRYACRLRAKGMTKEEALALVLQAARNCTPPFPEDEAKRKVESAWRYPEGTEAEQMVVQLKDIANEPDKVWDKEVIGALAVLKKEQPAEYARIKAELKGKVNLNDLERAVNRQIAENQKLRIVEPGEKPEPLENILPNLPLKELQRPHKWTVNENGIWTDTKNGPICACAVPVILTQRLKNVDTGEEKVELAFYRDREWHKIKADRTTVFNRTSIIQLTNKSLPVTSENARDLVRYLQDLEQENLHTLPIKRSTTSMGWVGNNFLPGAQGDIVLDLEDGTAAIADGYRESGTLEKWVQSMEPVRKQPIARFMLAASFAAPLLKLVGQRVFIIHSWGSTRGGKTAALKAALSVWGCPEDLIASFNATKVGLERLAAFYCDLPLGIDERQVIGDKQGFVESIIYLLGLGKGKVRGAKGGGLQTFSQWRCVVLSTGEEPLSTDGSMGGIKTRVLELYGRPIPNEDLAMRVHQETGLYFGTAGPEFVRRILRSNIDFQTEHMEIQEELKKRFSDNLSSHITAIAVVMMADYLASQWIFGLNEDQAFEEALGMAEAIAGTLETAAEADDGLRAYEYLMSWYGVNIDRFKDSAYPERYGLVDCNMLYIYPTVFEEAMRDGGFNPNRILREWSERSWIATEIRSNENKRRLKVRKYCGGRMSYFVGVRLDVLD